MTIELNDDDLRGLSENERQALLEAAEDDADGDVAAAFGKAASAAPAPAAPGGEEGELDEEDEAAVAQAAASTAPAPAAAPEPTGEPVPSVEPVEAPASATPRATPDDIEDQRKTLGAREDESMQKLLDGEISIEDHAKVKAEVRAGLDKLLLAQARDQVNEEVSRQALDREYFAARSASAKEAKAVGLDYSAGTDMGKEFDGLVVMFAGELLNRGIGDTPGNLANSKEALRQAHQVMLMRHGKTTAPAPAAPAPSAPPKGPRPPVNRGELPPTLANTPAAADASVAGNKFAHLDAIENPAELERALARLSPAEQEEYLGG